ncbi:hypothetical protein X768_14910 [Mesorhizobium sp. LSJC265A00]|nr:hypothetical protein X768_14910 [Mesorhizobium sp. LSJC265A00]
MKKPLTSSSVAASRSAIEIGDRADDHAAIGMRLREQPGPESFPAGCAGLVEHVLAHLVLDHRALQIELGLSHRAAEIGHAVGLQRQDHRQ